MTASRFQRSHLVISNFFLRRRRHADGDADLHHRQT